MELADAGEGTLCGKGFYNEFGINAPVGFDEAETGGWFHKIGVGLLRKKTGPYDFSKAYEIQPLEFEVAAEAYQIRIHCQAPEVNGYSYILEKEIELLEKGFEIRCRLENTGQKTIATNEYNHNFLAIDRVLIGPDYVLKFPFPIKPALFGETVNPGKLVDIGQKEITFQGNPRAPFFFSNLSGGETVDTKWALENRKSKIGISETGNFFRRLRRAFSGSEWDRLGKNLTLDLGEICATAEVHINGKQAANMTSESGAEINV